MEAVGLLLFSPFMQRNATRELRLGIARAFVAFTRGITRPEIERHAGMADWHG